MKTVLTLPPSWEVQELGEGRFAVRVPGAAGEGVDVTLRVGGLLPIPADPPAWKRSVLGHELPSEAGVAVMQDTGQASALGWPMDLVEAHVHDAEGRVLECRLAGFYVFLAHVGVAMASAPTVEALAACREELIEALLSARPDWSGPIVALAQLGLDYWGGWS